jgi:2-dehydro-3-deoxygluconokinase
VNTSVQDASVSSAVFDVIALGETMLALAPPPGESLRSCSGLLVDHAGAESNTCVGLSRLGLRVAWVSRLGSDAAGDRVLEALRSDGIDTTWVRRDPDRPTGLMLKEPAVGVRYYRTGSAASVLDSRDLANVPVASSRAVLVTGVTALIGPRPHAAGLALLASARGMRIVDPNLRAGLWGSDRRIELVGAFIERCDLLLAGAQELAELLGGGAGESLARRAAARGPQEVVVRDARTVGALRSDGSWHDLPILRDAVVDPIGAGDAFNAGYIAVRLRNGSVEEALAAGVRCGASVTGSASDTSGFPHGIDHVVYSRSPGPRGHDDQT